MEGARERWFRLVRRWRRSGQTAREFARGAGINPSTLAYWSWRLNREDRTGQQAVSRHDWKSPAQQGSFVELIAGPAEDRRSELELVDGRRLRVPPDFDAAALGRLLAVLGSGGR
jgi:transposase